MTHEADPAKLATAAAAAKAAVEGAASNVMINLPGIEEKEYAEKTRTRVTGLRREATVLEERVERMIQSRSVKAG